MAKCARENAHFEIKILSSHQCLAVVSASAEPDIH